MFKRAWSRWKHVAHVIGNFQARVLLSAFYAVIVFPVGIITRLLSDPLRIKRRSTQWLDHTEETNDLQWAKRQ